MIKNSVYAVQNEIGFGAAYDITSTLNRFRSLGYVPDGDVRDPENTAFFLNGSAIAQNAKGISFQMNEIKKPERWMKMYLFNFLLWILAKDPGFGYWAVRYIPTKRDMQFEEAIKGIGGKDIPIKFAEESQEAMDN